MYCSAAKDGAPMQITATSASSVKKIFFVATIPSCCLVSIRSLGFPDGLLFSHLIFTKNINFVYIVSSIIFLLSLFEKPGQPGFVKHFSTNRGQELLFAADVS